MTSILKKSLDARQDFLDAGFTEAELSLMDKEKADEEFAQALQSIIDFKI